MTSKLHVPGPVPNKKDNYAPRRGGKGKGLYIPSDIQRALNSIQLILQNKWQRQPPLTGASVDFRFLLANVRHDLDGMGATLQDCLVNAKVLAGDSVLHVRENHYSFDLVPKHKVGVEITLIGEPIPEVA